MATSASTASDAPTEPIAVDDGLIIVVTSAYGAVAFFAAAVSQQLEQSKY